MDHKNGRWAREILALQQEDGLWGTFHTLSSPTPGRPMTTEQALRRLEILGFTHEDPAIFKTLAYMHDCLAGARQMPDRREKTHNWDLFTQLMLSAWIRRFTPDDPPANAVARTWGGIIGAAFSSGCYDPGAYGRAYEDAFGMKPRGGRLVDFVSFYQVSLLAGEIGRTAENAYFDYVMNHGEGIYYVYDQALTRFPTAFASRQTGRYLAAVELLCRYPNDCRREKLRAVAAWMNANRGDDGLWDLGSAARDGVYFPLSDSWRDAAVRKADCTARIGKILAAIER